ncbi:hypothetical protein [Persephonella sp.]
MMNAIEKLLDELKEKLVQEKQLLISSISDPSYSEKLMEVVEEKRKILAQLAQFNREDFEGLEEKLWEIKNLSDVNLNIAAANAHFIEEVFSAIFEDPQKYDKSGTVQQSQKGLFNKKI